MRPQKFHVQLLLQVGFIAHRHAGQPFQPLNQVLVLLGKGRGAVENRQHQLGGVKTLQGQLYAGFLHEILCFPDTGGVGQPQDQAVQGDSFLHHISGGPGDVCDNALFCSGQQVHQGGFPHIGLAQNDGFHPFPDHFPLVKIGQQPVQLGFHIRQGVPDLVGFHRVDFLLRVVHISGDMAADSQQAVRTAPDFPVKLPLHSAPGAAKSLLAAGHNQIRHAFRLGQGHLSV